MLLKFNAYILTVKLPVVSRSSSWVAVIHIYFACNNNWRLVALCMRNVPINNATKSARSIFHQGISWFVVACFGYISMHINKSILSCKDNNTPRIKVVLLFFCATQILFLAFHQCWVIPLMALSKEMCSKEDNSHSTVGLNATLYLINLYSISMVKG